MSDLKDTSETKSSRLQIWGAGIILLMIVLMLFPINLTNRLSHQQHGVQLGTASNGRTVMSQDRMYASNLFEALGKIYVNEGGNQLVPLLSACWPEATIRDFKAHPEALYLVLQESRAISPGASPLALGSLDPAQQNQDAIGFMNNGFLQVGDLHPLPGSQLGQVLYPPAEQMMRRVPFTAPIELRIIQQTPDGRAPQMSARDLPPLDQDRFYAAMNDFLTIQSAASLTLNALKPTKPMIERAIASRGQLFTLQLATFDASKQLEAVPQPTDEQLQAHFKQFADVYPGTPTREDPFAFGYRVPDRVKLQLISFRRGDVRKLVEAEKTPYEWQVAARTAFLKSPSQFAGLTPATGPSSTQPTTNAATQASTSTPPKSFDDVATAAIAMVIDRAADTRVAEIERRIRAQTLFPDFLAWNTARTTKATTLPTSSLGVAYDSPDYLQKLADDVQNKFKIRPIVESYDDRFRDAAGLNLVGGFRESTFDLPAQIAAKTGRTSDPRLIGPVYALQFAKELMSPRLLEISGDFALDLYKPSERLQTLRDGSVDEVYYFRLVGIEKNHAGNDLAAIREQVAAEWRRAEAQRLTFAQAKAAADTVRSSGDFNPQGATVSTLVVGPFNGEANVPQGLDLQRAAYIQFGGQLADKLLGDGTGTPVAALDVPLAGKAFVARRVAVTPTWNTDAEFAEARQSLNGMIAGAMARPRSAGSTYGISDEDVTASYMETSKIFERNAWKPAQPESGS